MIPHSVQIPYPTYQNLLDHLQIHASTDGWAASLLNELQEEAKPVRLISNDRGKTNGAYTPK